MQILFYSLSLFFRQIGIYFNNFFEKKLEEKLKSGLFKGDVGKS
jgi:hypothetical protein